MKKHPLSLETLIKLSKVVDTLAKVFLKEDDKIWFLSALHKQVVFISETTDIPFLEVEEAVMDYIKKNYNIIL